MQEMSRYSTFMSYSYSKIFNIYVIKVPLELLGHVQQIYNRALYSYGESAPCYSPPKMLEDALMENLRCDDFKNWSYSIQNIDGSAVIRHHGVDLQPKKTEDK